MILDANVLFQMKFNTFIGWWCTPLYEYEYIQAIVILELHLKWQYAYCIIWAHKLRDLSLIMDRWHWLCRRCQCLISTLLTDSIILWPDSWMHQLFMNSKFHRAGAQEYICCIIADLIIQLCRRWYIGKYFYFYFYVDTGPDLSV